MATESTGSGQQSGSEIGRPRLLDSVSDTIRRKYFSRHAEQRFCPSRQEKGHACVPVITLCALCDLLFLTLSACIGVPFDKLRTGIGG